MDNYPELITDIHKENLDSYLEIACNLLSIDVVKLLLVKGAVPTIRSAAVLNNIATLQQLYTTTIPDRTLKIYLVMQ